MMAGMSLRRESGSRSGVWHVPGREEESVGSGMATTMLRGINSLVHEAVLVD
jgi:hypothetical protein